jgi:hypothetical protein
MSDVAGAKCLCAPNLLFRRSATALKEHAMATSPDLPTPITSDPPDLPELPVEPDKGPATPPGNPTDPESPFTLQPE